ncbi:MAG: ATP-binding protein, partial [Syntrophothermus sp.]
MRINFRILLINFAIVAVILISSVVAFYSLVYNVIENQQSKFLQTSTNNFLYSYNELLKEIETNFLFIKDNSDNQAVLNSKNKNIDFIFSQDKDSSTLKVDYLSEFDFPQKENITLKDFSKKYPQAIVLQYKSNDKTYFYGKLITNSLLNDLSKRINADIALSSSNKIIKLSNNNTGNSIPEDYLKTKSQLFKVNKLNINDRELLANKYEVSLNASGEPAQFIIFSNLDAADKLLRSLNYIISIIGLAGIVLSLILVYLFTDKFRKQIQLLSKATEITGDGKFKNKIKIESKDELGQLANAFNIMVDELEKNQKLTNEYSDFITLIINNPGYASISETALKKIVYTGGFAMGALFRVDDDSVTLTSSYGINKSYFERESYDFFKPVIDNKETKEVFFNEDAPLINTGFIDIRIKYLIVIPIIYHEKVIAVLELGAVKKPLEETNLYITKIKDQLAIGLVNAAAVTQLENLIKELKNLNEDYHKQNIQVVQQNERLLELHRSLKEKADELEIQKIKAEESTRLKSHFLASISHELRTPMNSILGLTELLLEEKACTGKNKERLEVVVNSGKRLMSLINDILDLSKIEAGKMELHYEDTIIGELLNDIDTSIQPLLSKKDFQFKIIKNVDSRIIINTDKGKITQVLLNLLVNAIKFTEKGYVHLKVNKIENGKIKFDVIDTGIGISKDDQAIIFEEFRQLDGTTTRKYNGTGLGLAISRRIAGMMNGSITVESSLGAGSTFSFEIPVSIVGIKEPQEEIQVEQEKTSKKKNLILIIDSDPKVRYTIGQYLITKG